MLDAGTSVDNTPQNDEQAQQAAYKAELDRMMSINLNGGIEPQPTSTEPPPVDNPVEAPPPVTFETIREKFNYSSPEDAIKEIEELRAYKAAPPKPEFKFENTESEKLFEAIASGKRKEAYQILDKLERLETITTGEVTKDNAGAIIKMGMQLKNPTLTQDEIDYRYNKQFGNPKEPVQGVDELDDEFANRKAAWKEQVDDIEMNRRIEAKLSLPELELAKSKIVFPEVNKPVDEGYNQYLKMLEDSKKQEATTIEEYKKFTPKTLETKVKFTDEPNKIDFEFQHEPSGDDFKKVMDIATDFNLFWDLFTKPDGSPDREGFAQAIYFGLNRNKVIMEAIKQTKNATIKAFIPDNNGGAQRQFPQSQQPNQLDELMQLQGIRRAV